MTINSKTLLFYKDSLLYFIKIYVAKVNKHRTLYEKPHIIEIPHT